jgi:hypothetical protein
MISGPSFAAVVLVGHHLFEGTAGAAGKAWSSTARQLQWVVVVLVRSPGRACVLHGLPVAIITVIV